MLDPAALPVAKRANVQPFQVMEVLSAAAARQRVRGDISTMITERPDEVAAMLRGWLTESKS